VCGHFFGEGAVDDRANNEPDARRLLRRWGQPSAAVREHLVLVLTFVACVVAAVAAVSYVLITQAEDRALALYERRVLPTNALRTISDRYAVEVVDTVHKVSAQRMDPSVGARRIQHALAAGEAAWRDFVARSEMTPARMAIQPLLVRARAAAEHAGALLLDTNWPALDAYRTQGMYAEIDPLTEQLAQQVQAETRETDSFVRETRAQLRRLRVGGSIALVCVALLGWAYVANFSRCLSRSIGTIERVVRKVAGGDLSVRAGGRVDDAFAVMAADIDSMIQALERSHAELVGRSGELERAAEQARSANAAKSLFLSSMSHELRTPLNVILGYAQVLAREPQRSESDRHALGRVMQAGAHLLGLIEDVLSISKIEAGKLALRPQPFETQVFVEALQGMFAERATQKGLGLRVEADAGLPAWLHADAGRLRQVLVNLIGNALKFTDHGEVRVRLWYVPGHLHASVADTGPGISPEELAGLFQRFFQGAAGQHTTEGAGLGLYISRSLVRLMGGQLVASSQLGSGSEFRFEIAAEPAAASARAIPQPLALAPGTHCDPMLVADDREDNREVLCRLLHQLGFEVEEVCDGAAAVDACARTSYAIVWMDLRMPKLDGQAAMRCIREADTRAGRPPRKIIAVTASVIELDRDAARAEGFDELVGKPFSDVEVTELIGSTLGVRFVPSLQQAQPTAAEAGPPALDGLSELPGEQRSALLSALIAGDTSLARGAIAQVESPPLSRALRTLVDSYAGDSLIAALRGIDAGVESVRPGERE
jgi:signal transduction histidine kinase/CheY-like chemotaxis protein